MKMIFDPYKLLRANIRNLKPYSSAREEFSGKAKIFLDANENSFGSTAAVSSTLKLNRYPDPLQIKLKKQIGKIKNVFPDNIFLGNGSDEPIDLLYRAFCEPGNDSVLIMPPTYGMYKVAADINNVRVIEIPLTKKFQPDLAAAKIAIHKHRPKILFICSPNNPTGNIINRSTILELIKVHSGLVVLDEAYIDFIPSSSYLPALGKYPNLVILQTLSKAWGMAGARLGMAYASKEIIQVLNKIKYPYNINVFTQTEMNKSMRSPEKMQKFVKKINEERNKLSSNLGKLKIVQRIFHSDANFLLVRFHHPAMVFNYLRENGIIVRNRVHEINCENCLRITVGTPEENRKLVETLVTIQSHQ